MAPTRFGTTFESMTLETPHEDAEGTLHFFITGLEQTDPFLMMMNCANYALKLIGWPHVGIYLDDDDNGAYTNLWLKHKHLDKMNDLGFTSYDSWIVQMIQHEKENKDDARASEADR